MFYARIFVFKGELMNIIPVVFTFDKRIVLGASVAIKSLIDCAKEDTSYDIYVYHPDISSETIAEFQKMFENTNHKITFQYISKEKFKDAPISKHGSWTEIVYYRLLIPDLLPQYDKVIYADCDVLFKGDLAQIYNEDMSQYDCAMVAMEKNNENMICHKYFPENKKDLVYISSFIIFNCKKLREENFTKRVYEVIEKFNNRLKFFDLDTINIASKNIKALPYRYGVFQSIYYNDSLEKSWEYSFLKNVYSDENLLKEKENTVMLHYAGAPGKPWRFKKVPQDYREYMEKIPKKLKKYTFRDIRKRLFSKV